MVVTAIDRSFKSSDRTYGSRRVWHDLLAEGLSVFPAACIVSNV
jgi:putative transposase